MADFVFTSPGVKFKERDLTYVTRNVGITTLGLAGETLKGPAFEPVFIQDQGQFAEKFGAQSTKRFQNAERTLQYQLPYVGFHNTNKSLSGKSVTSPQFAHVYLFNWVSFITRASSNGNSISYFT